MRILVTGVSGQLGFDVVKRLTELNIDCRGVSSRDFDLTDREAVLKYIKEYAPYAVIHCAAYTAVDKAEDEPELCFKVNGEGTRNIALACRETGAKLLYISTDYVFPGTGESFYEPFDPKAPLNVYGKSKLMGEEMVQELLTKYFIVRISWVFGLNGNNFVKTMLRLGRERAELSVVADQIGSPTYTADLAVLLTEMIQTEKYGVYHATNEEICSWADFAAEIFRQSGLQTKVKPIASSAYPTKAVRPLNSRLSKKSLAEAGFNSLPRWQSALERYLKELGD